MINNNDSYKCILNWLKNMPMKIYRNNSCDSIETENQYQNDECHCIKPLLCDILCTIGSPTFGLAEIKTEVAAIEEAVLSATFGLAEIKTEVAAIEGVVFSATFGLEEIKTEVFAIQELIESPLFGLEETKTEIFAIQNAVFSPTFGLEEIKTEISQIQGLMEVESKTTGPVVADPASLSIIIKLFNNTTTEKTASATVYTLTPASKVATYTTTPIILNPQSAQDFTTDNVPDNYVVEFTGLVPGVYGWTSTSESLDGAGPFIEANTFRHSELVPNITN